MARFATGYFDLAIVDPPYGRKEHGGVNRSTFVIQKNGTKVRVKDGCYVKKNWDLSPPPAEYFTELRRVSKQQIVWGINYFSGMLPGAGRIVWDKVNGNSDQSDCELAYYSGHERVDLFRYMWAGMMQGKSIKEGHIMQGNTRLNERRIHPTQKPIKLYLHLLDRYAKPGYRILDTHVGSQSSRIAAWQLGFEYIGFEVDQEYFNKGNLRFNQHISQQRLDFK